MATKDQVPVPEELAPRKSKLKLIIIAAFFLVAAGLSGGAAWYFLSKRSEPAAQSEAEKPAEEQKKQAIYEVLTPPFVVNFNNNGRQKYLQVSVALMGRDQAQMDALKEQMPLLRDQLVMQLSSQKFDALITPEGKEAVRKQLTTHIQELAKKITGQVTVEQVLFTNFVLQ